MNKKCGPFRAPLNFWGPAIKSVLLSRRLFAPALIAGLLIIGCGSDSPSAVVKKWHTAVGKEDQKAVDKLVSLSLVSDTRGFFSNRLDIDVDRIGTLNDIKGMQTVVDGNKATVTVLYNENMNKTWTVLYNGTFTIERASFTLVQTDGGWKLSSGGYKGQSVSTPPRAW